MWRPTMCPKQSTLTVGRQPKTLGWRFSPSQLSSASCMPSSRSVLAARNDLQTLYPAIQQQVWDIHHASTPADFRQRSPSLLAWSRRSVSGTALEAIEKLCAKQDAFLLAFDFPNAYRTSNMIDRHMDPMDRWLVSARFFHGHWSSAELQARSWAILNRSCPYCPRADAQKRFVSPVHKLNGFVYHDNWLHNLLISSSCAGLQTAHRIHYMGSRAYTVAIGDRPICGLGAVLPCCWRKEMASRGAPWARPSRCASSTASSCRCRKGDGSTKNRVPSTRSARLCAVGASVPTSPQPGEEVVLAQDTSRSPGPPTAFRL